jgi:hypothetical protein
MTKPDQTGPNRTGILNFQLVARPKPLPHLYRFFTQIKFKSQGFGKTGRFPVVFPVWRMAKP